MLAHSRMVRLTPGDHASVWSLAQTTNAECGSKGVAVKPRKGDALLFHSLHIDGGWRAVAWRAVCRRLTLRGRAWRVSWGSNEILSCMESPKYSWLMEQQTAAACPAAWHLTQQPAR